MLSGTRESKNETGRRSEHSLVPFFLLNVLVSWIAMCSLFEKQLVHPQMVRSGFQSSLVSRDGRYTKPSLKSPFTIFSVLMFICR